VGRSAEPRHAQGPHSRMNVRIGASRGPLATLLR
jgi:hypothetical protein